MSKEKTTVSSIDRIVDAVVAQGRGDHPALVLEDGTVLSYAELNLRIDETAQALADLGLVPGHRMMLVGENSAQMVVALLGCIRAGGWAVPLNGRMSAGEIDAIRAHCEPRFVFCDSAGSASAATHASRLSAPTDAAFPLGALAIDVATGTEPDANVDVALMIYTSGSTGEPKGVMLTHANLRFVMDASLEQKVLLPGDVAFHALPISHSFGLISALLCGLQVGATLHLVTRYSAEKLAEAIADGVITVFQGVPAMYARLHEWQTQTGRSLQPNRLRLAYIGGSQVDATRKAQAESMLGVQLHHGYGLTEAAPVVARTIGYAPPLEVTAGWPIPGIEVEVQNGNGHALACGTPGEVCVRGPNVMRGYFRAPEQTREAIDARGWLHTGDIGFFGSGGDLQIAGRIKEMIIRSGFNVYPAEVERAIAAFPGVAQCAVVGRTVPGDEEVVAFVEPIAGQKVDTAAMTAFLRERLAPYKLPRDIRLLAQLPASPTGKLLKARLKAMANAPSARPPADLERLLAPRSVAVVGASDNPNKVGGRPIVYLREQGFQGSIYPVNPRAQTIQGLPSYVSLDQLPEVPDAVVLCVGADQVEEQLELCARLKVPNAVLFASSYAEVGDEGRQRQERLLKICREGGVRLVGPNSIGVASFNSGAILSFASIYADHAPEDGPIAIVSQSGAFGVSAYALLRQAGWGVRCVAATGNEADLDTADFVDAVARSPGVKLVLLYLENVPDPLRMAAALDAAQACGVRVVSVRAGRSPDARRSAELHTGSPGASDPALDAMFEQHGCRTVAGLAELVQAAPLYLGAQHVSRAPPAQPRLVLVSNSGASCVLAADQANAQGLRLAELSDASRDALAALLPDFSLNRNPLDLTAMLLADPSLLGRVVQVALQDAHVDSLALGLLAIGGPSYDLPRFVRETVQAQRDNGKPVVFYSPHPHVREAFARGGLAVFPGEAAAIEALRDFHTHGAGFPLHQVAVSAAPSSLGESVHA
ncbi:AMP-binding protein [Variovorax paradoxus]|uniref:AMP-binding protein n=1 Tax=Variovorax paradoxus TaxID=34073 RepID=UPI003D662646